MFLKISYVIITDRFPQAKLSNSVLIAAAKSILLAFKRNNLSGKIK
jgi:hypothetical protein